MEKYLENVGKIPLVKLKLPEQQFENINLFSKLEFLNPSGSVKDRAAKYILDYILENKIISKQTTIVESSSGNFGIALSMYCKKNGLSFICVIDPHINKINEIIIRRLGARVIKVTTPDNNGGYLLKRLERIDELLDEIPDVYWINQYANPLNAAAYYHSLGEEICNEIDSVDYVFLGVSSGGTITGVSRKIKERFPGARVIAVDMVGSVIFNASPRKRHIPGIGSSKVPDILKQAYIDEVVWMDELETIEMCHNLLEENMILAGGSSGAVYGAIKKYFTGKTFDRPINVVTVFPDKGERYLDNIYNEEWKQQFILAKINN